MTTSPIEEFLAAFDRLDIDAAMSSMAPGVQLLTADGRRAQGSDAVRELIAEFMGPLRTTEHKITAQWHEDDVWIAEVEATYELQDWLKLNALPRAFIARMGTDGIADLRAYGAHEHPLTDHRTGEEGMLIGTRWMPPL